MRKLKWGLAYLAILVAMAGQVRAGLITSSAQATGTPSVVDFSQLGGFQSTAGPVQIGQLVGENITWSSNSGNALIGNGTYNLGSNGQWDGGRNGYTGTNSGSSDVFMRYDFLDSPVATAGGFINYFPGTSSVFLQALGTSNQILESHQLDGFGFPSGTNQGLFFGVDRGVNDIAALVLRGGSAVLDDLLFARATGDPPPPATIDSSREFAIRNTGNGDPNGLAITNNLNAEVGNLSGGSSADVRGISEFDLNDPQLQSASKVDLEFATIHSFLESSGASPNQSFGISVEAFYTSPGASITDFEASSLGGVGTFNTLSSPFQSFDVTNYYNQAISQGQTLGFRLMQTDELSDFRQVGWTYGDFRLSLSYDETTSAVPEPTSLALWGLGALGMGVIVRRRQGRRRNSPRELRTVS